MILRSDLYGSIAILIGILMYLLAKAGWSNALTLNALFIGGCLLRLTAYRFHWQLPGFQNRHREQSRQDKGAA